MATIVNPENRPQMATVRSGVMKAEVLDPNYKGEVIVHDVAKYVPETEYVVKVIDRHVEKAKNNLKGAAIVIAGGYGMGSKEGFDMLYELAHELHAEVGGSRAAVDVGFCDHDLQIGQTGVTVRPKVYIACGISGAIQHIAGMKESGIIISVNSDPNAPINAIADYVINGTVEEVVPKLIKYYKQNKVNNMANYYSDIPELKYHLENPMMKRIVELKERDFRDKDEFDYAPVDYADAMDSYNKVLDIVGDITANVIAPNAEGVDEEGPHCHDGRVDYASGTSGEPGRHGQGRYERHDDAAQVQRVELPLLRRTRCVPR